ncbi:SDR family NAD(P)-dependent oxidoreductase [Sphingopyxis terrae]|uniref:SDR family NAD(P)-dependent oxidoreductase n=1 Tax=Sphingopyxis terrae TaxID=33052 RepID=UPI002A13949D|nr:SDR family NAD(P)-dependent oxidoreductase [Sphingopyxis terrae]MDX8356436.1 SDR family NAD(P)-dependent oxidoreductase [Sphingopyxis terrae]
MAGITVRDKVAVVTGAGSGVGRALALTLAARGCHVVISDISEQDAQAVAAEVSRHGVRGLATMTDVSRYEDVERLADLSWATFGQVDLLFNNAGVFLASALAKTNPQDAAWLFSVNVGGVFNGIRAFAPRFVAQGLPAHICNTGSEHSLCVPNMLNGIYTATKHAVLALSDVLRRELPPHVGVSILCPGVVATNLWDADRNRHDQFGGRGEGNVTAKLFHDLGMDAADVAERAIAGVERGDFYIVTHPHDRQYVADRGKEVLAAFDTQAPWFDGADQYEPEKMAARLRLSRSKAVPPVSDQPE